MPVYRIVGIEAIAVGRINATTYAMASTFTTIDAIVPESAKLIFESPEPTQFFVEDSDDVDVEIKNSSKKSFEFATYNMGNRMFLLGFGGSTSGASITTAVWKAPTTATTTVEKCLVMTSKAYGGFKSKFEIPHVSIRGGGELKFSKTGVGALTFSGTVLKAGTANPMKRTFLAG